MKAETKLKFIRKVLYIIRAIESIYIIPTSFVRFWLVGLIYLFMLDNGVKSNLLIDFILIYWLVHPLLTWTYSVLYAFYMKASGVKQIEAIPIYETKLEAGKK